MDRGRFNWAIKDSETKMEIIMSRDENDNHAVTFKFDAYNESVVNRAEWAHLRELVDDMFDSFCDEDPVEPDDDDVFDNLG